MYYQQTNTIRKIVEMFLIFSILFVIDRFMSLNVTEIEPSPFNLIIILFSIRYGWKIGMLSFLLTLLYFVLHTVMEKEDLFLLFYEIDTKLQFIFFFIIAIVSGTFSTSQRERYDDLHFQNEELRKTLENVDKTIKDLSFTNKILEEKVLESETSIASVYQMTKLLDQDNLELITDEAMNILATYFHAESFGIYHLDRTQKSMRLKVRKGEIEELPQTIFLEDARSFYERLLIEKKITVRKASDPNNSPIIAGPITRNGEIKQVLIIKRIDFYRLTDHGIQLLYWLLQMISDSYAKVESELEDSYRDMMYKGTNIFYKESFDEYVEIEQKRGENFSQQFAVMVLQLSSNACHDLESINNSLLYELREVDKVGFDKKTCKLYILFPGSDPNNMENLKSRIQKRLQRWVYSYDT